MITTKDIEARIQWIKEIVRNSGAKGVALGLSGGKDSAVVAALIVKAGIPIFGVNMPIQSNPEDTKYVRLLSDTLNISVTYLEPHQIGDAFNVLYSQLGFDSARDSLVLGNMKARLRMLTIYAFANKMNYLVAGTGNASEAYVGYFTKWGDGAHDFNPIADLHVSEVIELGLALGLPEELVKRTPSAGLWAGQTDEGEMGVTYAQIEAVAKGNEAGVSIQAREIIQNRHKAAAHKLNPIPTFSSPEANKGVCW